MQQILAAAALAALSLAAPARAEKLTPERVFSAPSLDGPAAKGVQLSPDGKRVTYLKAKPEAPQVQDLWAADVAGGEPYRIVDAAALSDGDTVLSEAEKARRERMRISSTGVVEYRWDEEGRFILVPLDGDLFLAPVGGQVRRLTKTDGDEVDSRVSPKGNLISFVRDQNLYVLDPATGAERAITTGGKDAISYGVAEFIAQEEMGRYTGYWWSPDESRIAYTRVDESGVDIIPRADIGPQGATVVEQRYPRAGRPNAVVELYIQPLAGGAPVKVDLGSNTDIYLARADWARDGRTLYVQRQSRDQRTLDLLAVDPATGASKVIATQTSPAWIELTDDFHALTDGRFIWSSEQSGYRHLYLYSREGRQLRQLTRGNWPVDAVLGVDESTGRVLFAASKDTPIERQLYSVSYERSGEPKALTSGAGWWKVDVAKTGGAFAGTYSDPRTPPRTGLYSTDGKLVRWIEENRLDASHPYAPYANRFPEPEYGVLKAADGSDLHYVIERPPGFDPAKKYPAIVNVYGGPGVQRVMREWQKVEEQLLQEAGFIVFTLDNRGSTNRSVAFKTALNRNLGKVETEDQLAGVRFLKSLPYVDPARIGVDGWSYGGFMTLMMMTEPGAGIAAGVSGAPPTEWSFYDSHYTERFMGQPGENVAGYAASDMTKRIDNLSGRLLLVHGMADDNVIFANTTRLMADMQKKGVVFDFMAYPGERHGVRGNEKRLHLWRTFLDFFGRTLSPEPAK